MKVAITVWETRISPVFDSANRLLIAEIENAAIVKRDYERLDSEQPACAINKLVQLGVATLICGAISQIPATIIEGAGIRLVSFISGEVETILAYFSKGIPVTPKFLMPGCGKMRHRHGGKKECMRRKMEGGKMPKGDGTGPKGQGAGTGKGRGGCETPPTNPGGQGKGRGRGGQGKGQATGRGQSTGK